MSSFRQEFEHLFKVLKIVEEKLNLLECVQVKNDLLNLVYLIESPLFFQLVNIQNSLLELKTHSQKNQLSSGSAFDFDVHSGKLVLFDHKNPENEMIGGGLELWKSLEHLANGRQMELIILERGDNTSLGFGVVGLLSNETGELGVYVKDIQPDGVAARNGRLKEEDEILSIDEQVFDAQISHQQAIHILQKSTGRIALIVAHSNEGIRSSDLPLSQPQPTTPDNLDMVLSTEWTQLEVINLINDGSGLGFGIIGGKSTGVVVKTILSGGVADRNGRLQSGDHLLQIGDINVRGMGSEQVASVLRQSSAHVRLIVARGVIEPSPINPPYAPIIPTQQLNEHIKQLNALMTNYPINPTQVDPVLLSDDILPTKIHPPPIEEESSLLSLTRDVEIFEVKLVKDVVGLGITVVGYENIKINYEDHSLSGIFIRSISEGSAAALNGRIHINDQIIAVDDVVLNGFTIEDTVGMLRNTGQVVHLKLARYRCGSIYEQLIQGSAQSLRLQDEENELIYVVDCEDYDDELKKEREESIKSKWQIIIGDEFDFVVTQVSKFKEGGGLGISLEGTVDVENGIEVHPHHYIRSILSDGPVGMNGRLQNADELLEVNGITLFGLNHVEVVTILKELPQHVQIVCARHKNVKCEDEFIYAASMHDEQFFHPLLGTEQDEVPPPFSDRLIQAKSDETLLDGQMNDVFLTRLRSRSLELLSGLAMWGNDVVVVQLEKGDKGLGFSILDYQDPINPEKTVIIIRSLVPGGIAQLDGRLVPGDRLLFVNDINLEHASLDKAVQALKGATKGMVVIGVTKPLPLPDIGESNTDDYLSISSENAHDVLLTSLDNWRNSDGSGSYSVLPSRNEPSNYSTINSRLKESNVTSSSVSGERNTNNSLTTSPLLAAPETVNMSSDKRALNDESRSFVDRIPSESLPSNEMTSSNCTKPELPPKPKMPCKSSSLSSAAVTPQIQPSENKAPSSFVSSISTLPTLTEAQGTTSLSVFDVAFVPSAILSRQNVTHFLDRTSLKENLLPSSLERNIEIHKRSEPLGIVVESFGPNGCQVKSIVATNAIAKDGRIKENDYITSVNNENMRCITNTQARAILRRISLLATDVSIVYISAQDATLYFAAITNTDPNIRSRMRSSE